MDRVGSRLDVGSAEISFFGGKTLSFCPRGFAPLASAYSASSLRFLRSLSFFMISSPPFLSAREYLAGACYLFQFW
jgi:hypothetical protein